MLLKPLSVRDNFLGQKNILVHFRAKKKKKKKKEKTVKTENQQI